MAVPNKSECRRAIENDRVGYETRVDGVSLCVRWSCCGLLVLLLRDEYKSGGRDYLENHRASEQSLIEHCTFQ